jgi:hypothetical protein
MVAAVNLCHRYPAGRTGADVVGVVLGDGVGVGVGEIVGVGLGEADELPLELGLGLADGPLVNLPDGLELGWPFLWPPAGVLPCEPGAPPAAEPPEPACVRVDG